MQKLNLSLDYNRTKEAEKEMANADLTSDYISFAITQTHKEGIEGQLKRVVGRLLRKLDVATASADQTIELEDAEVTLLKKSFDKVKVPPQLVKYWIILEDEIEKLK